MGGVCGSWLEAFRRYLQASLQWAPSCLKKYAAPLTGVKTEEEETPHPGARRQRGVQIHQTLDTP